MWRFAGGTIKLSLHSDTVHLLPGGASRKAQRVAVAELPNGGGLGHVPLLRPSVRSTCTCPSARATPLFAVLPHPGIEKNSRLQHCLQS